jgi:Domain of unknown function (DUF4386)
VYVGALFEILTLAAGIGMAVTLYPVLRRQSESLALGYVTVRVVESCLIAVGIVSLLAVVTLRRSLAGVAGTDHASLILSGRSLVAVHDATFLLGPAFCAAIGNGLILGYLMLRSGLGPRRFAQFGIAGGSLALLTALLVLFGAAGGVGPARLLRRPRQPGRGTSSHSSPATPDGPRTGQQRDRVATLRAESRSHGKAGVSAQEASALLVANCATAGDDLGGAEAKSLRCAQSDGSARDAATVTDVTAGPIR